MKTIELISAKLAALGPNKSPEAPALERIKDIDDPSQWITVVEIDNLIDVDSSLK
jgi:hypothetical protein